MKRIEQTLQYERWYAKLRDINVRARIDARIYRLVLGLYGDVKSVGGNVSELRIDYGPGYRVYFTEQHGNIVILLAGGDKRTQTRDIETAKRIASSL